MRRVLEGHADDLDQRLVERQAALVQTLAFEQAARLQNQRETLARAARGVRRLRAAQRDDARARLPGAAARLGRRSGASAPAASSSSARWAAGRSASRRRGRCSPSSPRPSRRAPPLPATAIDEMLLVHSWVDAHRAAPNVVDLRAFVDGGEDAASAAARLLAAVRLAVSGEPEDTGPAPEAPAGATAL